MIAYILRGLPGSGKSTLAQALATDAECRGLAYRIHSTDDYHVGEDGVYRFQPEKLAEFHRTNQRAFKRSLEEEIDVVIVDNTNVLLDHFNYYLFLAADAGYKTQVVTVGMPSDPGHIKDCVNRNVHGVPEDTIRRMARRFQF